jgi:hypothetical protein
VQCDRENNPDALAATDHFKAHVFYQQPDAKWFCLEVLGGEGDWFIIDSSAMESDGL